MKQNTPPYKASVTSFSGFQHALEEGSAGLHDKFEITLPLSLAREVLENADICNYNSLFLNLVKNVGMTEAEWTCRDDGKTAWLELNAAYYPGKRIWYAARNHLSERILTADEKETLKRAERIACQARGTDDEKERYIHDALCESVVYYTNEHHKRERKDSAIGVLIDGRADCDGISDAFYLCCSLAGIPVRYLFGRFYQPNKKEFHMRNLVQIGKTWVMTDVTWDDRKEGKCHHLYFNIGTQEGGSNFRWEPRAVPVEIAERTNGGFRPKDLTPIQVSDWSDLCEKLSHVTAGRPPVICVTSKRIDFYENEETLRNVIFKIGIVSATWNSKEGTTEIQDISYARHFCFAKDVQTAAAFLTECAEKHITAFRLSFPDNLAGQLRGQSDNRLVSLLSTVCVTCQYHFHEAGFVDVGNAVFRQERLKAGSGIKNMPEAPRQPAGISRYAAQKTPARKPAPADTENAQFPHFSEMSDIAAFFRRCGEERRATIIFICDRKTFNQLLANDDQQLTRLLSDRGCMIRSISTEPSSNRITVIAKAWRL